MLLCGFITKSQASGTYADAILFLTSSSSGFSFLLLVPAFSLGASLFTSVEFDAGTCTDASPTLSSFSFFTPLEPAPALPLACHVVPKVPGVATAGPAEKLWIFHAYVGWGNEGVRGGGEAESVGIRTLDFGLVLLVLVPPPLA